MILLIYYSFLVTSLMTLLGFFTAKTIPELISAIMFFPLAAYFTSKILPVRRRAINFPTKEEVKALKEKASKKEKILAKKHLKKKSSSQAETGQLVEDIDHLDLKESKKITLDADRRKFLKVIGSASVSMFLLSILTRRAEAAFFGSVPGPGTVAVKDTTGTQIDPAVKQPTDGYRIVQIDETTYAPTSYYGFQDKDGAWFIMQDNGSGNYRYTKGASDFTNATTGWPNRDNLSYGYFEAIF